jgi:hypothetical protein
MRGLPGFTLASGRTEVLSGLPAFGAADEEPIEKEGSVKAYPMRCMKSLLVDLAGREVFIILPWVEEKT